MSGFNPVNNLNPHQKAAVKYIDGPLLVLAGAGSGKTSVITRKISWLVNNCQYNPKHITAVTFTNKAAREMQERIQQQLGPKCKGLQIGTFHQLGLKIIQNQLKLSSRKSGFSILDAQDAQALLKEIMLADGDDMQAFLEICQKQISDWKNQGLQPYQLDTSDLKEQELRIIKIYEHYQQALRSYNAVDFDDLIAIPTEILSNNEEALNYWQKRIHYLLVDEYQDTNTAQYRLIKLLVEKRHALCVVGDDDQSIYTWRGANPENLNQLAEDFNDLKVIKLEQNYRSSNRILQSANQLIANNSHIFEKKLWSEKGLGEQIEVYRLSNEEAEAEFIVNEIINKRLRMNASLKDFAVLVRGNHQTKLIELKLQSKQLAYHITGGTAFFSRNEIKDILAYLRVICNPDDNRAFLRIVNTPRRKIGTSTLQTLGDYATTRGCSLFQAIGELGLENNLSPQSLERLRRLTQWFENITRNIENSVSPTETIGLLNEMIDDIDYANWLNQNCSSASIAEKRMENINYLIGSIKKEIQKIHEDSQQSEQESQHDLLEKVIAKLMLIDLLEQQSEEEIDNKIQIMTLHASKGLEFPHVFITGFEEEIIPHRNSIETDNIEEERRLAYVGITRAKETLTITMAKHRKQFGEQINCEPSRFLSEIESKNIKKVGFNDDSKPEDNIEKGRSTLSSLKALLD